MERRIQVQVGQDPVQHAPGIGFEIAGVDHQYLPGGETAPEFAEDAPVFTPGDVEIRFAFIALPVPGRFAGAAAGQGLRLQVGGDGRCEVARLRAAPLRHAKVRSRARQRIAQHGDQACLGHARGNARGHGRVAHVLGGGFAPESRRFSGLARGVARALVRALTRTLPRAEVTLGKALPGRRRAVLSAKKGQLFLQRHIDVRVLPQQFKQRGGGAFLSADDNKIERFHAALRSRCRSAMA